MALYCGLDLHSSNILVFIGDEKDRTIVTRRLPNELSAILGVLEPRRKDLEGIVVESTFNWYWLVDGLMDQSRSVHLANPCAIQQYKGLKATDDWHDAGWLAHLLRLGLLPTGCIYPQEDRPIRDLLCRRTRLVTQRTSNSKSKGSGNRKNGNPYLSWAFSEAAHLARRFLPQAQRF